VVVLHAYGLGLLNKKVTSRLSSGERHSLSVSSFLIGETALAAAMLRGIEGIVWAAAYRFLGALTDNKSAMLAKCHDELRTSRCLSGAPLANDGRPGSIKWLDSLRSHHGISLYCSSEGLAPYRYGATTPPLRLIRKQGSRLVAPSERVALSPHGERQWQDLMIQGRLWI
jgi:hypothetical protein